MDRTPTPPVAEKRPHHMTHHGITRTDEYYWLNQREDEQVLAYLRAENEYKEAVMQPLQGLQEALFDELKGRIKENDETVPYKLDEYWYYVRFVEGGEYPIYCRKEGSLDAEEEVVANGNELAKGHSYFEMTTQVSPDHKLVAIPMDTVGRRIYDVKIKNLETGEFLPDVIKGVTNNVAWANDSQTLFYTSQDAETLRNDKIYRHALGSTQEDELVFDEKDDTYNTGVYRTKSRRFLMIGSFSTVAMEFQYLDADTPDGEFTVIAPRKRDHLYYPDHAGDHFYIRTNDDAQAPNFQLVKAPIQGDSQSQWEVVIPHRKDVFLESIELFQDYLVLEERKEGLIQLLVRRWDSGEEHYVEFGEPAYVAGAINNMEFNTSTLRYNYQSLTTPSSTFDYDMGTRAKDQKKEQEILGGFDKKNYTTERHFAKVTDGTLVPISLVYRTELRKEGKNPCLVYAYGSYGYSMEPYFRSSIVSLLDRGFVYAIAHIRGGQEMGRHWYDEGKLLKKKNTFTDFVDCTEFLIEKGIADADQTFAMGGSAGGLLMGAVINLRPDLYKGVVAAVPFVDVVTTMLDDSIPLTTGEYDEWGNPNTKEYYEYMLSYSPYDQVGEKEYPNLLITTGLHDSQVQYWEPAKWTARLRDLKTGDNLLLMHTNMEAGHGGASGRFEQFKETAMEFAFMLDLVGITK
ncbi:MAG TPA: oligopeptidase B [Cytophagales bacterium]|nr:oligopeptidase B [Cytophagales bacterium]HAA23539.1 oligopeptidase B [Cytophagales bacterium]HAP59549.1 oligopeptidase B [Cytophagales bacterium]